MTKADLVDIVAAKTGLTKRIAYKMLVIVGERTSMIYLGCFVLTAALTLVMAHTAVAATIYPLLLAIYALYASGHNGLELAQFLVKLEHADIALVLDHGFTPAFNRNRRRSRTAPLSRFGLG